MRKGFILQIVLPLAALLLICSCNSVSTKPIKFAFVTDIHISGAKEPMADLESSIADMNTIEDLDFVIFGGDITEFGSDEEIMAAKKAMDNLKHKYYIVSGNHDSKWSESGCNTFAKVFGYEVFDFEYNGVRFLGCNSGPNMRMAPALVPRESMVWLDSLTSVIPKDVPVIFINHYPLDDAMLNYAAVKDMLKRVNIQVAICGHGHNDRVMDYLDIRGAMGRSNLRTGKEGPGYNIVTIADGQIIFSERVNGATKEPWHKIDVVKYEEVLLANSSDDGNQVASSSLNDATNGDSDAVSNPVNVIWKYQDNSDIGSAPAIWDGLVYISNTSGVVKALDSATGSDRWSYATNGKIFSSPEVSDGLLVVGSSDNFIYCLDAKTGNLVWKVEAKKSVLGSPAIYNGVVYIGASDNIFRAINLKNGEIIWSYSGIKGFIEAKPWVDSRGIYIGDWANTLYAFNPKDGELLWSWSNSNRGRMYSPAAVWPVKTNNRIFIATPERVSYAINARNGKELWRAAGGREAIGLSSDEKAYYIKTMQDTVIAFSTRGRHADIIWKSNVGYGYEIAPSPITVEDGLLFVPTDKGDIFALNENNGSVAWRYKFSIALINYIRAIGDRKILVTSMDGKVAILQY